MIEYFRRCCSSLYLLSCFQHVDVSVLNINPVVEVASHPVHQPCQHSARHTETTTTTKKKKKNTSSTPHTKSKGISLYSVQTTNANTLASCPALFQAFQHCMLSHVPNESLAQAGGHSLDDAVCSLLLLLHSSFILVRT